MRTHAVRAGEIERKWYVVDANGQTLGRLASRIAQILKGKHKPTYTTHLDVGDFVIVVNADKVATTGNKLEQKMYYRHSGYPGGMKITSLRTMLATHPNRVIEHAVKGMLPHNKLGVDMLHKLKVYGGPTHPHEAQQPENLAI
jgi:large subunit ribosomal protein L13